MINKYKRVGIDFEKKDSGQFLMDNNDILICKGSREGVDVSSLLEACKDKSVVARKWSLIDKNADEICQKVAKTFDNGYFVRSKKNVQVEGFVQTCLSIGTDSYEQSVHNMVIAEEGSSMHVLTGCTTPTSAKLTKHNGVTEIFVGKRAKLTYTMVHSWGEDTVVRPKTAIRVEEGGEFVSNYVCIDRVGDVKMYPKCVLAGKEAFANMNTYLFAKPKSNMDVGTAVELKGENSRCLVKARVVSTGGNIWSRGIMDGLAEGVSGHLECTGLIIKEGVIHAIPEIIARIDNVDLTHEASVGRVSKESIEYLQSRGFSEQEALGLILKGFLDLSSLAVPASILKRLNKLSAEVGSGL